MCGGVGECQRRAIPRSLEWSGDSECAVAAAAVELEMLWAALVRERESWMRGRLEYTKPPIRPHSQDKQ